MKVIEGATINVNHQVLVPGALNLGSWSPIYGTRHVSVSERDGRWDLVFNGQQYGNYPDYNEATDRAFELMGSWGKTFKDTTGSLIYKPLKKAQIVASGDWVD